MVTLVNLYIDLVFSAAYILGKKFSSERAAEGLLREEIKNYRILIGYVAEFLPIIKDFCKFCR